MAKEKRTIIRVKPNRVDGGWTISYSGDEGSVCGTQAGAIALARSAGRMILAGGGLAQLVVHGRDMKIRFENTYGRDPRRYKG